MIIARAQKVFDGSNISNENVGMKRHGFDMHSDVRHVSYGVNGTSIP